MQVQDAGGQVTTQAFTVSVAVGNVAPQITSAPVTAAIAGNAYGYGAVAVDPNGDALSYSLTQTPAGMSIQPATGVISWVPAVAQVGNHTVALLAADAAGLAATQAFTVSVSAANDAPQFTSMALTTAAVGVAYAYDAEATDTNGDTLTYALTQAPGGMTISAASGLIGWVPQSEQVSSHAVTVRVADAAGLASTQSFTLVAGGCVRVDRATPATYNAISGSTVAIGLNWGRIPLAANYQQFMHRRPRWERRATPTTSPAQRPTRRWAAASARACSGRWARAAAATARPRSAARSRSPTPAAARP